MILTLFVFSQDLNYDAAIPLYVNRKFFVEFLHERVLLKSHQNILEDFLYVTFRSLQYVAMARANAIIDLLVSRPLRWLSGKSSKLQDWSPYSMGEALDLVEQLFERAQHDGSVFLDPALDLFKPIADKQPLFANWREHSLKEETILAPDGKTKHLVWKLVRDELLLPNDATNKLTHQKTIEYLEVQCIAGLRKMHDPKLAIRDKLTSKDGANAVRSTQDAHRDTVGCHATNDALAESVFGTYDMILRRCPGISMEAASAVSQSVRSQVLAFGDHVAHRKSSCKPEQQPFVGYLYSLPEKEQESLVELARVTVKEFRDLDGVDHKSLDEYHQTRRKTNEANELDALFTQYALALSFFERWCKRGVEKPSEIEATLRSYGDRTQVSCGCIRSSPFVWCLLIPARDTLRAFAPCSQEKLDWLREQVEMRSVGLSWSDWKTPWSSSKDEYVGTVEHLTVHLKEVLTAEQGLRRCGELPSKSRALLSVDDLHSECPAPQMQRKTFKKLGTPTVQATSLSSDRTELTREQLLAAAERRRAELEAAGEIDWVCDRQPHPTGQVLCACII